jgi:hypothetical protein
MRQAGATDQEAHEAAVAAVETILSASAWNADTQTPISPQLMGSGYGVSVSVALESLAHEYPYPNTHDTTPNHQMREDSRLAPVTLSLFRVREF